MIRAINDSIKSMTFETLTDYDVSHPAGSDISDIVDCVWVSSDDFIRNGYRCSEAYATSSYREYREVIGYSYIDDDFLFGYRKPVSEVNLSNTRLTERHFAFVFMKKPSADGEHRFRVTFHYTSRDISVTFTKIMTKEEGSEK